MNLNNRRYIGSKTKLLEFIYKTISDNYEIKENTFLDVFSGTGIVADYFADNGFNVIANDLLYSNYVTYKCWLSNDPYRHEVINSILMTFNKIKSETLEENYFSKIYGGKYFSQNDAKKIGYIREEIELLKTDLQEREYFILLSSLLFATDKIANTVGHFEHFLSKLPITRDVKLVLPNLKIRSNIFKNYNQDANELVRNISGGIIYIDPPYNARQYVNFYHVLENLARWEKPNEFEGSSMKFKRNHLKSDYSKSKAPIVFQDLIDNINADLIVVSYNNTYNAKSGASNNKITFSQIYDILSNRGDVQVFEQKYKFFNSGKTNFTDHKEKLFICKTK